jgi:hypothetical protein
MASNKDILEVLTKTQLVEISRHLGLKSWQVISHPSRNRSGSNISPFAAECHVILVKLALPFRNLQSFAKSLIEG